MTVDGGGGSQLRDRPPPPDRGPEPCRARVAHGTTRAWASCGGPLTTPRPPRCSLLSNKLEIQAEILNHRRYTVITERYCMTHSDTGHQNLTVKSICDFSLLSFNILIQILPFPRRSVHVTDVNDYSNADDSMVKVSFVLTCLSFNPCPIRFRWQSVTHVHVSRHVRVSEQ